MTTRPDQDLERLLAQALRDEGERIVPADRLDDILAEANLPHLAEVRPLHSRRIVLAAAAAAAVVAGGFWTLTNGADPTGRVAAPPAPSVVTTATVPSSPDVTTPPTGALEARPTSVPVYLVGRDGGTGSERVLVRVFDRVLLIGPARAGDLLTQVSKALARSTSSSATGDGVGTIANADATLVTDVTTGDTGSGDGVVVRLASTPQVQTEEGARQLLAAWVRTVQGIVGRGDVPVRFRPADGGPLFGHLASDRDWRQGDVSGTPLASIWIDDPSQSVPGPDVTARGIASVWEAGLRWELLRAGRVVDSGTMTATEAAPARGSWQVRLSGLAPDSYELRVIADSAKDGGVAAERRAAFVVTGG